jgi:hypothetical protein
MKTMPPVKKAMRNDDAPNLDLSTAVFVRGRHAGKPIRLPLAGIRSAVSRTQVQVAKESGMAQGEVSTLEGREELGGVRIDTVRRYVEGLGGQLELVAVFPSHRIVITPSPPEAEVVETKARRARSR